MAGRHLLLLVVCAVTAKAQIPSFGNAHVMAYISSPAIDEASGLAASQLHPGILYTHNDHGDAPNIYAINATTAALVATLRIGNGATNHDWEDIAVGPCGTQGTCIYIADTGYSSANDNEANIIYRVQEPADLTPQQLNVSVDSTLRFNWTEEESQAVMVDPDANVYLVSNVLGGRGMVVKLPPVWGQAVPTHVASTTFLPIHTNHHDPTAADISPDGKSLLIKTKNHVYYWSVPDGDYLAAVTKQPYVLPYIHESVGEAICWSADGQSYYTLAEGHYKPLYQYQARGH